MPAQFLPSFVEMQVDRRQRVGIFEQLPLPQNVTQKLPKRRVVVKSPQRGICPDLIIGQAPGRITRQNGRPWDDASGNRLRDWLEMDKAFFYHSGKLGIVPMGFCYPGKGKSGDLPPRPECAPAWHALMLEAMPEIGLTLLVGKYAQDYYLHNREALTQRVKNQPLDGTFICLPHPSPRNGFWLKQNPWFESKVVPALRKRVQTLLGR